MAFLSCVSMSSYYSGIMCYVRSTSSDAFMIYQENLNEFILFMGLYV